MADTTYEDVETTEEKENEVTSSETDGNPVITSRDKVEDNEPAQETLPTAPLFEIVSPGDCDIDINTNEKILNDFLNKTPQYSDKRGRRDEDEDGGGNRYERERDYSRRERRDRGRGGYRRNPEYSGVRNDWERRSYYTEPMTENVGEYIRNKINDFQSAPGNARRGVRVENKYVYVDDKVYSCNLLRSAGVPWETISTLPVADFGGYPNRTSVPPPVNTQSNAPNPWNRPAGVQHAPNQHNTWFPLVNLESHQVSNTDVHGVRNQASVLSNNFLIIAQNTVQSQNNLLATAMNNAGGLYRGLLPYGSSSSAPGPR